MGGGAPNGVGPTAALRYQSLAFHKHLCVLVNCGVRRASPCGAGPPGGSRSRYPPRASGHGKRRPRPRTRSLHEPPAGAGDAGMPGGASVRYAQKRLGADSFVPVVPRSLCPDPRHRDFGLRPPIWARDPGPHPLGREGASARHCRDSLRSEAAPRREESSRQAGSTQGRIRGMPEGVPLAFSPKARLAEGGSVQHSQPSPLDPRCSEKLHLRPGPTPSGVSPPARFESRGGADTRAGMSTCRSWT